jgi:hypothetical protein
MTRKRVGRGYRIYSLKSIVSSSSGCSTINYYEHFPPAPCLLKQIALAKGCSEKTAYDFASGQPGETDAGPELTVGPAPAPPTTT